MFLDKIKINIKNICILYFGLVCIYFLCNINIKTMDLYPDSLRFFDLAKNIIKGNWFVVRGVNINYQKILYSICISPFFLIKDVVLRMKSIELFNILVAFGSIFPTYFIIDNIIEKEENKKISLFIYIVSPIFLYSKTILSESLYIFLFMWTTFWLVKAIKTNQIRYYVLSAIFLFLSYMCREIAIVYFISIVLTLFLIETNLFGFEDKKDFCRFKYLKNIIIFVLIFILLVIIVNNTLLKNVGYTYGSSGTNQIGIEIFKDINVVIDFIFSCIYMLCGISIIFLIFPLIIPFVSIKNMNRINIMIFLTNILNILGLIVVIAYSISIREDVDLEYTRLHFRYMICSIPIIMFIIINCLDNVNICNKKNFVFTFIILGICIVFFRGMEPSYFDNTFLYTYRLIDDFIKFITCDSFIDIVRTIVIDIILLIIIMFLYKKCAKKDFLSVKKIIVILLIMNFLINTIYGQININKNIDCDKNIFNDVMKINEYNFDKDDVILFLSDFRTRSKVSCVFDTYNDLENKIISNDIDSYLKYKGNEIDVKNNVFIDTLIKGEHKNISHIDYIIAEKCMNFDMLCLSDVEEVANYNNYIIYKNKTKEKIEFK